MLVLGKFSCDSFFVLYVEVPKSAQNFWNIGKQDKVVLSYMLVIFPNVFFFTLLTSV